MEPPLRVLVTGGAGQIAYALIPLIGHGLVFGADRRVELHLLDIPPARDALEGLAMELEDVGGMHALTRVLATTDLAEAAAGVDVAILLGGFPRQPKQERADLLGRNAAIFAEQGAALNAHASRDVRVLVVANPANTNCLLAQLHAPDLSPDQFSCLSRLDHDRLRGVVSREINARVAAGALPNVRGPVSGSDLRGHCVWGNHSSTQFADISNAMVRVRTAAGAEAWLGVDAALPDAWVQDTMVPTVQGRGAAVLNKRGKSSALSAAAAVAAALRDWLGGTREGHVSMGVYSTGNAYGVPDGLYFSFPVVCAGGSTTIVPGLHVDECARRHMDRSAAELVREREVALEVLARGRAARL